MDKFFGRKHELELLALLLKKKTASLAIITGRRRIGKSRLVLEYAKRNKLQLYSFIGLPPDKGITPQHQRDEFARRISEQFHLPKFKADDWAELFTLLSNQTNAGRIVVLIDEISWMSKGDPTFIGKLKNAWDTQFKLNSKLILILCGSVSAWIEKNILASSGYVGRISLTVVLKELRIKECNKFWNDQKREISAYDKFKLLSITGGVPRYLEEIHPEMSAEENIRIMCFLKEGFLFNEFNQIFSKILLRKSEIYKKIVLALANKSFDPLALCKAVGTQLNSTMSEYFHELELAGFIERDYVWDFKQNKISKLSRYRLKDNYLRFYLKYILPYYEQIKGGLFKNKSITTLPEWETIMGLQFENLVLNSREQIKQILNIQNSDVLMDGSYFQTKTVKKRGCQIDYLIQTKLNLLFACEIKFSKKELDFSFIRQMQQKLQRLVLPRGFSYCPVLIHVNGVKESVIEKNYFTNIIDFSSLLEE